MPSDTETRASIKEALNGLATAPILSASRRVFEALGYRSERRPSLPDSKPSTFLKNFDGQQSFNTERGMVEAWKTADFLCQVTDEEIQLARKNHPELLADGKIEKGNARSFVFLSIGLNEGTYTRTQYSGITREINRLFNMPAICLFKNNGAVTLSVIDRRQHKKESAKDVLEKVTLIKDIEYKEPHRGHIDILSDLALPKLAEKFPPLENFDHLLRAWRETLDLSTLNKRFYRELSNWYFWALPQVRFPADLESNDEKLRATSLIRLLTRLIFCWFLKEKDLIPDKLFRSGDLENILKVFDPESETSSTYYLAILQNLFFATLNQRMGKDSNGNSYRTFAKDDGFQKNRSTYDVNNLYRYEALFKEGPEAALALFADIPFLNGGLFECLDQTEDGTDKKLYLDGFSRNPKKRPHVPDRLFFDSGEVADLSDVYDDKKRKAERVTGLINILDRYKFTIVENTPIDQEVALDPELLGKVFENLLASYNEETKTTARKQTGSFYTPRPIVDYMVDESLKAHLTRALVEKAQTEESDARSRLDILFAYTEKEHGCTPSEVATLIAAIDGLKILDPACGSGAFPMGVLHKLVYILGKLDPKNDRWKQTQLAKLDSAPMREELERTFADNNDDYGRKLYLIENCLFGVDIQPIAIQITKLRFFISLVCDQKTNRNKKENHGICPLPNLETKFVAANSLIGLPEMTQSLLIDPRVGVIEKEIESLYHSYFSIQRRDQKLALQRKVKTLRQELGRLLGESLMAPKKAQHVAEWNPFDPQASADFFDPHWMFGKTLANGFDIVIGNPPYVDSEQMVRTDRAGRELLASNFKTTKGNWDLYIPFWEVSLNLAAKNGCVHLITPNKWLAIDYGESLRELLLPFISRVSDFSRYRAFENVGVFAVAVMAEKISCNIIAVSSFSDPHTVSHQQHITKAILQGIGNWGLILSQNLPLVVKLITSNEKLKSICSLHSAFTVSEAYEVTNHLKEWSSCDKDFFKFINTGTIDPYVSLWGVKPTTYIKVKYNKPIIPKQVFRQHFPQRFEKTTQPKIIISGMRHFEAFFDKDGSWVPGKSTVVGLPLGSKTSAKFLLGLLNSSIPKVFFRECYGALAMDGGITFTNNNCGEIPVPIGIGKVKNQIEHLVDQILDLKDQNVKADTSVLERQINILIYSIYDLTSDEIAIVEGKRQTSIFDNDENHIKNQKRPRTKEISDKDVPSNLKESADNQEAKQKEKPKKKPISRNNIQDGSLRIDETEQNDVLCTIRQMFSEGLELTREEAFRKIAKELGYDRVGSKIEEILDSDIRTAVKRGILENERGTLKILCKTIEGYDRDFLKDQFLASIGRPWVEREEAVRAFTRFMGFRRAGEKIQDTVRSLIIGLLREDRLESDGQLIRRRS